MPGDWFKVHRKIVKSRVFQSSRLFKVWFWCLARANWKETWVSVKTGRGRSEVHLLPGQFVFGRKKAAKALRMPEGTVRYVMAKLVAIGNLTTQSKTHYTIVTVCNWSLYQDMTEPPADEIDQPTANHSPTNHQPSATEEEHPKKVKKEEDSKKNSTSPKLRFDDDDHAIAAEMFAAVKRLNPNQKPPNLDAWANTIRLMRERDGPDRTTAGIRALFAWANADPFWSANVLSPETLRKQWDRLVIKKNGDSTHGRATERKPSPGQRFDPDAHRPTGL